MTDAAQQTCGTGLAENSVVPEKLANLAAAMAEVLERHTHALILADENAKTELDAYTKLVGEWRAIAANLQSVAAHMTACHDLPMARHNAQTMASADVRGAFRTLVGTKQELVTLLRDQAEGDQRMLSEMDG
jgi:hypothetical protein